jgi:hypothetical protein
LFLISWDHLQCIHFPSNDLIIEATAKNEVPLVGDSGRDPALWSTPTQERRIIAWRKPREAGGLPERQDPPGTPPPQRKVRGRPCRKILGSRWDHKDKKWATKQAPPPPASSTDAHEEVSYRRENISLPLCNLGGPPIRTGAVSRVTWTMYRRRPSRPIKGEPSSLCILIQFLHLIH